MTEASEPSTENQHPPAVRRRVEVLCLTYGEPPINEFRPQYEYSLSILRRLTLRVAPIPRFILPALAARRGRQRALGFAEEGYISPLEEITKRQVSGIQQRLERARPDIHWSVRMVCEFRTPYIWEFLSTMTGSPPDDLVILPVYVAESDFTSGVSRTDLADFHRDRKGTHGLPEPKYLKGFGFEERMGKVFADFVWNYCVKNGWTEERCAKAALILGAHGTLQYPPPDINSGARETLYFFGLIRKHLKDKFRTVRVGWLNHTLGGKWTFPEVGESARECQDQGIKEVVYFPFGFMGDNAESQCEGKAALEEFEWDGMLYLPCVNDDPAFLDLFAELVQERLDEPGEAWEEVEQGTEWLINREKPPLTGKMGHFNFGGPALAAFATAFWLLVAALLTWRGAGYAAAIGSEWALAGVLFLALFLGLYKGDRVMARLAKKNLVRLRRIPQPSPLWMMYSKATWIIIAFFVTLGISLRFVPMLVEARATILLAVGLAMFVGVFEYLRNFREATPIAERPKITRPSPRLEEVKT